IILGLNGDTARYQKLMTSPYYKFNTSDNDTVRNQINRAVTDLYWTCPYQALSRSAAQSGIVYTYRFDHGRSVMSALGLNTSSFCMGKVCHSDDVVPLFGSGDVFVGVQQTGDDAQFSRQIIDRVATFARTGSPNPRKGSKIGAAAGNTDVTQSPWRVYSSERNDLIELNLNSTMSRDVDKARCDWVEENVKFDYQLYGPGKQNPETNTTTTTTTTTTVIPTPSAIPSGRPSTTESLTTPSNIVTPSPSGSSSGPTPTGA
ncbi:hypothetical protein CPB97_009579, partial [Podila verticillata]